jgi:hypothetical protein
VHHLPAHALSLSGLAAHRADGDTLEALHAVIGGHLAAGC